MELDELKKAWKQDEKQQPQNQNIMELIHHKSKGPIASLKTAFRKQMSIVTVLMCMIIATNAKNVSSVSSNILFWTYIGFCLAMIAALYVNYRLTREMENMDENVKSNLEQHILLIEQRLKWQATGARIVILFFIFLLEIIPLYQQVRMLDKWHSLSPVIRFSSYAAYLAFQYFISRSIAQKKFGRHLDRLKELVKELY
jgi:hypothetical protein